MAVLVGKTIGLQKTSPEILVTDKTAKAVTFALNIDQVKLTDVTLIIALLVEKWDGIAWQYDSSIVFKGSPNLHKDKFGNIIAPSITSAVKDYLDKKIRVRTESNNNILYGVDVVWT